MTTAADALSRFNEETMILGRRVGPRTLQRWKAKNCTCSVFECVERQADGSTTVTCWDVEHRCAAHAEVPERDLYSVMNDECHRVADVERALVARDEFGHELPAEEDRSRLVRRFREGVLVYCTFHGTGAARTLEVAVVREDGARYAGLLTAMLAPGERLT